MKIQRVLTLLKTRVRGLQRVPGPGPGTGPMLKGAVHLQGAQQLIILALVIAWLAMKP